MARYDREFLVPYLQDICTLYLSKDRITSYIQHYDEKIRFIEQTARRRVPQPKYEAYASETTGTGMGCLGALMCLFGLFGLLLGAESNSLILAMSFLLICSVGGIAMIAYGFTAKDRANQEIEERNQAKTNEWEKKVRLALDEEKSRIQDLRLKIEYYEMEIQRIDQLLKQAYSVNIIPRWYRDKYPAIYLYDWFSNGRADDLDMALNTFVLEEIKERLDQLIEMHAEEILNQRIMIANQYKSMEQQQRHNTMLCAKLDRIAVSNEDRNMYLSMIEANTAANAYFSAANYLKK